MIPRRPLLAATIEHPDDLANLQIIRFTGPYLIKKSGRKIVSVYFSNGSRTSMNLSRYKMCIKLGRILKTEENVDHKDEDKTNDSITNLQILTKSDNTLKQLKNTPSLLKDIRIYICPECNTKFEREACIVRKRHKLKMQGPFCNKNCAITFRNKNK